MSEREKNIREKNNKTGDLHLELAESLIEQGKYDEACENLLFCLEKDTVIRENAYPLIVDLLSQGHCVDIVPHRIFMWLRLDCYIEPEKKKAMYKGIAFGTEKLNKIVGVISCYITDFGGDETVGTMYDRYENLILEQKLVHYGRDCYDTVHAALCEAIEKGLDLSKLSDERLVSICNYTEDADIQIYIRRFLWANRNRDVFESTFDYDSFDQATWFAEDCIKEKNYAALIWLYTNFKEDRSWNYNDINDEFFGPIINCILASNDIQVVSDFIKANGDSFGPIYSDYRYYICEFVSDNYLDENGNVRAEWCDLTEVFTMLVDMIFDTFTEEEVERTFGCFNRTFVKNAFETCLNHFTDEALESRFEMSYGETWFSTIYGYSFITHNKEGLIEDLKNRLRMVREKYFD